MSTRPFADRVAVDSAWRSLRRVPLLEVLVAFSLFPAVYLGADRLAPVEAVAPVRVYYLAIVGATAVAIAVAASDRTVYPRSVAVFLAYLLFVGWAAYSLRWTVGPDEYAWYKLVRMATVNALLLAFGLVLGRSRRRVVAFALVMGAFGAWLSVEALYARHVLEAFAFVTVGSETYITHGRAIGFAVPALAYVLFAHPRYVFRVVAGGLVAVCLLGVVTAGSRGPFVALVVALGTFAVLEALAALAERRFATRGLLAAGGATVAVGAVVGGALRYLGEMPWTIERLRDAGESQAAETRLFMLREAVELWRAAPLRGHGIGSYEAMTATVHDYPHSVVAETVAELGLVGLLLGALVVVPPLFSATRARFAHGDALYSALVALFVFMFVNANLSFDLQSNRQLWFAVGLLALSWTEATDGWRPARLRPTDAADGSERPGDGTDGSERRSGGTGGSVGPSDGTGGSERRSDGTGGSS